MPADLDELFDALRHQVDAIPLAGAEPARRQGRHRDRVRAVVTVAVVVTVVVVGAGIALRPAPQAAPVNRRYWPPVPTVGTALALGGQAVDTAVATDGTRAYAAWTRSGDDTLWVAATDLRTGAMAWAPRQLSMSESIVEVVALPTAVVVVTEPRISNKPFDRRLYALDPRTGTSTWGLSGDDAESVVFAGDHVATVQGGRASIFDVASGSGGPVSGSAHKYVRALGWQTTADEQRVSQFGQPAAFADPRVVLVDQAGHAEVRDTRTGATLRTVSIGSAPTDDMAVFDGLLFLQDGGDSHIRVVDLTGAGSPTWELGTAGGTVFALAPCGSGRVCAISQASGQADSVVAFDVRRRQQLWQTAGDVSGGWQLSSAGGRILAWGLHGFDFYDTDGRRVLSGSAPFSGVWLGPESLLMMDPDGSGRLARWSATRGTLEPLGAAPADTQACASTATRWVCLTKTTLTTWNVGG
jgi:outer membrane protein assembly factor BamB